jgi:hypothetical protein
MGVFLSIVAGPPRRMCLHQWSLRRHIPLSRRTANAPTVHAHDCLRLDSHLFQLSRSVAPEPFASGAGLELNSSVVRAVVSVAPPARMVPETARP